MDCGDFSRTGTRWDAGQFDEIQDARIKARSHTRWSRIVRGRCVSSGADNGQSVRVNRIDQGPGLAPVAASDIDAAIEHLMVASLRFPNTNHIVGGTYHARTVSQAGRWICTDTPMWKNIKNARKMKAAMKTPKLWSFV
jgi:hypothetical protein